MKKYNDLLIICATLKLEAQIVPHSAKKGGENFFRKKQVSKNQKNKLFKIIKISILIV